MQINKSRKPPTTLTFQSPISKTDLKKFIRKGYDTARAGLGTRFYKQLFSGGHYAKDRGANG